MPKTVRCMVACAVLRAAGWCGFHIFAGCLRPEPPKTAVAVREVAERWMAHYPEPVFTLGGIKITHQCFVMLPFSAFYSMWATSHTAKQFFKSVIR